MKRIFGPQIPSSHALDKNGIIYLVNSHPAIDFAEQLPPNVVEIGGMQIKNPKPVPDDIDQFLRKGKKGAILMALGTNMRSDQIGQDAIDAILEAFRLLPDFNFVWKFETAEMLKNVPPNLLIKAWLPQNDILAHPSVKAFISHGGLLSTHESSWHGVPVVGIPFLADQHRNVHKSVRAGVAIKVDIFSLTTEKLRKAIVEVTHNPRYQRNMQLRSKRFRDQPQKPLERAVWWSEYLIRNPKPTHLKPAEYSIGLLGQQYWDIQLILLTAFVGIVLGIKKLIKRIFKSTHIDKNKKNL
jgi:glucuronosyltransferase